MAPQLELSRFQQQLIHTHVGLKEQLGLELATVYLLLSPSTDTHLPMAMQPAHRLNVSVCQTLARALADATPAASVDKERAEETFDFAGLGDEIHGLRQILDRWADNIAGNLNRPLVDHWQTACDQLYELDIQIHDVVYADRQRARLR